MKQESYRSTWTVVHLDRVTHNVKQFKRHLDPETKFMAVVKADGYGHGAVETAKAALKGGASHLAVAVLEEGIALREAGIKEPILLLSPIEKEAVAAAVQHDLSMTVFSREIAEEAVRIRKESKIPVHVHLKIDTGMNRIGVRTKEEATSLLHILEEGRVQTEGIFTHFADADNLDDSSFTYLQYRNFMEIVQFCEDQGFKIPIRHCCNTAATLAYPELQLDMVRVGIGLYGLFPTVEFMGMLPLEPVMEFKTTILALKTISHDQTVGYGRTFTASANTKIATIPVGYADGYSRHLSNKGFVSIRHKRIPIAGLICMDQTMLDVSSLPDVQEEEEVVLFGDPANGDVSVYDVAEWAGTIHYEIVCDISKRVPRIYRLD